MKTITLFMLILVMGVAGATDAAPSSDATVAVRTYNYAAVASQPLTAARSEAEHIFRGAGIALEWVDCRVPGGAGGPACTEPLITGRDLMLRLMDRPPAQGERIVALGESLLDRQQRTGVLMTVAVIPVRAIALRASTSLSTLLGRAIAHEIGHLLLGSAEHSRLGLMRAMWSQEELRGLKPADWGFTAREAARMRLTLRGTSRSAN